MPVTIRGSGQVPVQVLQTVKSDTFTMSSTTFADITGLSVTITPTSSSNKILILVNGIIGWLTYEGLLRLVRGSTPIGLGDAAGSRPQATLTANAYAGGSSVEQYQMIPFGISFLDSPATTSATTYKLQIATYQAGNPVFINRSSAWQNTSTYDGTAITTITVMEISG
jgi:hypothetical protein